MFLLVLIGVAGIFSAKYSSGNPDLYQKQLIWFGLSVVVAIGIQYFSPKYLFIFAYFIYGFLLLSLTYVLLLGSVHMGAKRWIGLGAIQLQPSEIGKLVLVCTLARFYSEGKIIWRDKKKMISGAVLTLVPVFLVFKQPDLGTSLVYIVIYVAVIFSAGMPYFYLLNMFSFLFFVIARSIGIQFFVTSLIVYAIILYKFDTSHFKSILLWFTNLILGISSSFIWERLKPYQKMRILTFMDAEKYSREGGWQIIQSKVAVCNGGFLGEGFLKGSQTQLKFLPEGHTDFIFSVIGEEFGTLGMMIVFVLFLIMIYRFVSIVSNVKNRFYFLMGLGITSIFIYQIFINVGMTVGMTPVTGLPLPFLSYGGSSLLFNMIMVAIMHSIHLHRRDF